jgi:hypothetical protein
LAAKTGSLQAAPFGSENCFIVGATISTANPTSLQPTRFRQRMLIRCKQRIVGSEFVIRYTQFNFGSESQIRCRTHNLATNVNSLHPTQFQQQIAELQIRCRQYNFDIEPLIHCSTHNSEVNVNSLQTTDFRQQITNLLQTIQLRQRIPNSLQDAQFGNEC